VPTAHEDALRLRVSVAGALPPEARFVGADGTRF
jgi:hypothetical protein